jgi:hypothetical protein
MPQSSGGGGLYALADSWLDATEDLSAPKQPLVPLYKSRSGGSGSSSTNKPSSAGNSTNSSTNQSFLDSYELPANSSATTTELMSPSKTPTLFLLDDCLNNMNTARQKHTELRNNRRAQLAKQKVLKASGAQFTHTPSTSMAIGSGPNAARALSAAQKLEEMHLEAARLEQERLLRRASYAEAPTNLVAEARANTERDKEVMMEVVQARLKKDKEAAERARQEPPAEFIQRMAKKAEDEARHAAFSKGKDGREAMRLGKEAYTAVKERYRQATLGEDARLEEEEKAEAEENERRREMEKRTKIPMFSTGSETRSRLSMEDSKADFAATKAWKNFEQEVHKWDMQGGRNEVPEMREAFSEYLTEKYMCQTLDGLASTITVTKIRKDVVNIIEQFVAGAEEGGGAHPSQNGNDGDDSDSDEDDDDDYQPNLARNVRLRELMEKKHQKKLAVDDMRRPTEELPLQEALAKQEFLKTQTLRYKNDQKRVQFEREKEENRFRKDNVGKKAREDRAKAHNPYDPWQCSLCSKSNEGKIQKCATCGRPKKFVSEKEQKLLDEKSKRENATDEQKAEFKKKAEEAKKINDDYLKFLSMKKKTDTEADDRGSLAGDITGLLQSLRGTLGPLSDAVEAPPVVTGEDWRVHEPNGRLDGQHVNEVNHDTAVPVDVTRKNAREDFLHGVGAGGEFAPKEGVNKTYHLTEAEKNYHEIKKPFHYDLVKKKEEEALI